MEENMRHFQNLMLYYFKKGKITTEMQKEMCAVYREDAVTDRTCQKWFAKVCAGAFLLDGALWFGRPAEVGRDQIGTNIN